MCVPGLIVQKKWYSAVRNLKPGDVVLVADRNTLRGDYRLGIVRQVFPDKSGRVRRVTLSYKNYKVGESLQYTGSNDTIVTRSVHRLALLVPVDDNNQN